jgi:hypothetical protein
VEEVVVLEERGASDTSEERVALGQGVSIPEVVAPAHRTLEACPAAAEGEVHGGVVRASVAVVL